MQPYNPEPGIIAWAVVALLLVIPWCFGQVLNLLLHYYEQRLEQEKLRSVELHRQRDALHATLMLYKVGRRG